LAHWERNELPTLTPEYQFHPKRRWRFDFCLPEHKIAIEIHGGTWQSGRHNRAQGFAKDREKMNAAQALGWVVIELTDAMLREGREAVDRYLQPVKEILAAGGTRLPDGGLLGSRRSAAGD
jgi:very-short-patch-repair endonuclease